MIIPLNIFTKLRQNTKGPIMTVKIGCIIYTKISFDLQVYKCIGVYRTNVLCKMIWTITYKKRFRYALWTISF